MPKEPTFKKEKDTISAPQRPTLRGETFAQLCARITADRRPQLQPLLPPLVGPTIAPSARRPTIEITGETNTGKTHLLMELMAHSVLARSLGGHESDVMLIDTEHHFDILKLSAMLEKYIRRSTSTPSWTEDDDDANIRRAIDEGLKRVHLIECHSPEQLELAISELDRIIGANGQIGLLALDSVATYYWLTPPQTSTKASNLPADHHHKALMPIRMDTHVRRLVCRLQRIANRNGIVMVYVRPATFRTKPARSDHGQAAADSSRRGGAYVADLTVELGSNDDGKLHEGDTTTFCATVWDDQKAMVNRCSFTIDGFGIRWCL